MNDADFDSDYVYLCAPSCIHLSVPLFPSPSPSPSPRLSACLPPRLSLKVALESALTRIDRLEIAGGEQEQRVEAAIGRVEATEAQKEGGSRSEMVRHLQQVRRHAETLKQETEKPSY